jgi:lantibiotic modifying enzyme
MFISDLVKNKNAHYIDFISDEVFIEYNYVLSILIETNQTVDEGVLKNGFLEVLFQNLFEILHKSMIVYLNELEIPSNKYIHTIIRDKKTKFIFFNKHKLLYSDCIKLIKNWGENTILTYNNIYCSLDLICKYFKYDREVKIETIQSNYGDLHNGNKCVLKINFNNEKSLYYKPRSGEQEIFYNKLLAKLDSDLKQNFKKLKILSFGCFHFVESIEYKECNTTEEVENFYIKIGIHLFLLYIMNSCDIHYENIICSGEDPVLIDLDTLVNPINVYDIFPFKNESNKLITKLVQISVMQSQLLGVFTIRDDSKVNLGGVSGVEDVFEKSFIIEGTTKPVRKEISKKVESSNLPIFNGEKIYPKEYEKHIIYGFKMIVYVMGIVEIYLLLKNYIS